MSSNSSSSPTVESSEVTYDIRFSVSSALLSSALLSISVLELKLRSLSILVLIFYKELKIKN